MFSRVEAFINISGDGFGLSTILPVIKHDDLSFIPKPSLSDSQICNVYL